MELVNQYLSELSLFQNVSTSPQIKKYVDDMISAFRYELQNELSGKNININNLDTNAIFNILSSIVKNRGGTVEETEETPEYRFGVFSDIHLYVNSGDDMNVGIGNGTIDFTRGLSCLKNHGVDFACIAGDIGMNANCYISTEVMYDTARTSANVDFPISCCRGNHDTVISEEMWYKTTSCDSDYIVEMENGKDIFAFMSLPLYPELSTSKEHYYNSVTPYSNDSLNFLSTTLQNNPNKNIFLFMHFPLNSERYEQYAGLGNQYYPGSSGSYSGEVNYYGFNLSNQKNEQNEYIIDLLKNYNGKIIVFHGHTHYIFENDIHVQNIIFSKISNNVYSIHVPSLNFPRNRFLKNIMSSYLDKQPSQGYVIERYEKYLLIKGYEFNSLCNSEYGDLQRTYTISI